MRPQRNLVSSGKIDRSSEPSFGLKKISYNVYRELFSTEQDSKVETNIFLQGSILTPLPVGTYHDMVQIDIVYTVMHSEIREKRLISLIRVHCAITFPLQHFQKDRPGTETGYETCRWQFKDIHLTIQWTFSFTGTSLP